MFYKIMFTLQNFAKSNYYSGDLICQFISLFEPKTHTKPRISLFILKDLFLKPHKHLDDTGFFAGLAFVFILCLTYLKHNLVKWWKVHHFIKLLIKII